MNLKAIDFLSPEITLFYNGSLSHSSRISGILTIVACAIIILCSYCYIECILNSKNETPKVSSYNLFIEDAGVFPINSSSFFHFISTVKDDRYPGTEGFDFTIFNLIGFDKKLTDYEKDNDLTKHNHWLYGYCNNEDTNGITELVTQEYFLKSACIKKYFDFSTQKYYRIGDPNFKWPKMAHGTINTSKEFYSIILQKCDPKILNIILDENINCKDDNEIEEMFQYGTIHFNFIDYYVDLLKYNQPNRKYFYRIENTLDKDNYSVNHLNFNPSIIKTYNGFIFEKYDKELSYLYERNDVFTHINKGNIYMEYYLWMNNRLSYYERTYSRIQDVLANVGGVAQAIMAVALFINNFINKYIILVDTQKLLSRANIPLNSICQKRTKINLKSSSSNFDLTSKKESNFKERNSISPGAKEELSEKNNIEENNNNSFMENPIYCDEKNYKFEDSGIVTNNEKGKVNINNNKKNPNIKNDNINLSFWNFFIYKFSFGKKHNNIKLYEAFREKVISVETLIRNHLNILNLLKVNKVNKIKYT